MGYNLCGTERIPGAVYYKGGTRDGHGGMATEHRAEMAEIATELINCLVPPICAKIYNQAVQDLIGAIRYDMETTLELSVKDMNDMLEATATRQWVSDVIMKHIQADLEGHQFSI